MGECGVHEIIREACVVWACVVWACVGVEIMGAMGVEIVGANYGSMSSLFLLYIYKTE